ncbi:MAG TPA: helix-turn-helix transcriptional regulator [Candidatus Saccharimonadia bacterium]|nr:helix-turn-helix transcriptional regulator [Candidatus Saccharimonadia bacterium]
MTDDKASIERTAAKLRKARLAQGLTQAQVAKKADISENHYAQVERGEKNPTVSTFQSIINAIGVSSSEILDK